MDPSISAPDGHRVTTTHISKAKASHLTQSSQVGWRAVAGTTKSHNKEYGCVILIQGGSKESEQQTQ